MRQFAQEWEQLGNKIWGFWLFSAELPSLPGQCSNLVSFKHWTPTLWFEVRHYSVQSFKMNGTYSGWRYIWPAWQCRNLLANLDALLWSLLRLMVYLASMAVPQPTRQSPCSPMKLTQVDGIFGQHGSAATYPPISMLSYETYRGPWFDERVTSKVKLSSLAFDFVHRTSSN